MDGRRVPRMLRAIRRRRRLSQRALASRIGVSQQELSRMEREDLLDGQMGIVNRWARNLGADLVIDLRVDGQRPLTDEAHAKLQNSVLESLRASGWIAEPEVSYSIFGERGRVDILAFHPVLRILLVIEIKTRVDDVQNLLGLLDAKARLASDLAATRSWSPTQVVPVLVVEENRTARRRVAEHAALFTRFDLRGRDGHTWLRNPEYPGPRGLLVFWRPTQRHG
jgi:transcriptional regulator with XRE-family HTH domain